MTFSFCAMRIYRYKDADQLSLMFYMPFRVKKVQFDQLFWKYQKKRGPLPCIAIFSMFIRQAIVHSWYAEEVVPAGHACAFAYVRSYYSPLFLEAAQHNTRLVICGDRVGAVALCVRVPHVRPMSARTTMMTTMTTTTLLERKSDSMLLTNGNSNRVGDEIRKEEPARFWTKIRLNEWTFSLSLLGLSLSIVIGKLYANYGE